MVQITNNQIFNEDCLETMARMPPRYLDLTVTSPPYDGMRAYKGFTFDYEKVCTELYRVTKPGGVVVWVVGDQTKNGSESGTSFKQALFMKSLGFNIYDTMIYQKKTHAPLNHRRYEQGFEYMFVFTKGMPKTFNPLMIPCKTAGRVRSAETKSFYKIIDGKDILTTRAHTRPTAEFKPRSNVWPYPTEMGAKGHPAQFPEALARDHIASWSNPGDLVYDPFSGSGTTAHLAKQLGRDYIGSEISKEYVEISEKRISAYCGEEK